MEIYPNPFKGNVIIKFTNQDFINSVVIFDVNGRRIKEWRKVIHNQLIWPAQDLSAGTYILRAEMKDGYLTKRVILGK